MTTKRSGRLSVGVADHGGWAVLVTATATGALVDRRRVELVDEALPKLPHHHEGQRLPLADAVALVGTVRASATRHAGAVLDALARELTDTVASLALRALQPLPATVAERITDYRAMCVADWVMYREALAAAATARGWRVHWFDTKTVFDEAARALGLASLDDFFADTKARAGKPWQQDHRLALAAAIAAAHRR